MEDEGIGSGGDYSPDLSSDAGSDTSSDIGSDYGSDLNSVTGCDLSGDLNVNDSMGEGLNTDSDTGMDEGTGEDLNGNDSMDDGTDEDIEQPETEQPEPEQTETEPEQPEAEPEQPEEAEQSEPEDVPDEYGSSFNDRIKQTPINDGNWDGDRGDSRWKPNDEDVIRDLEDYGNGADGIEYRNGFPDFTPVQVFECKMPNQLYDRNDDYQFTDCNLALLDHLKDHPDCISNFDDTQLAAIARGNNPSGYTWHHDVQTGRMQLVPTSIHDSCKHYGGKNVWGGGTANR